jgi:hypothetical protein
MELKTGALQAAKESLYYTGMASFNFEQDVASRIFGSPLPLEALRGVLSPFMGLEQTEGWSPLTVFAEQTTGGDGEEDNREDGFLEASDDSVENEFVSQRGQRFAQLMEDVLVALDNRPYVLLSEIIESFDRHAEGFRWLEHRVFYDFWLILHQRSPIRSRLMRSDEVEKPTGMEKAISMLGNRTMFITERPGILRVNDRYSIQEMKISWGDRENAI